ncbi:MAG TPA: acyltransferase [Actinomycetota bacterium]|nr:acyltransferase [Actinomycetota bacterium]
MTERRPRRSFLDLARETPQDRDRYVDFLRAFSIGVVVLGHWLIAIVYWRDGDVTGENALAVVPGLWLATWVLQVMPVFFFVGGFSNLVSWDATARRGGGYGAFLWGRAERLLRPTAVFIALWLPLVTVLDLFGVERDALALAGGLVARPLWFLGIYLIMIASAPAMIRLHRRFGMLVPGAMIVAAACVDVVRFNAGATSLGYLNFAFVWLLAHQLGFFYGDGTLVRAGRRTHAALAAAGIAGLVALTSLPTYPRSMVGLPGDRVSNMDPPTICIVALILWQTGLAMLARPAALRWLSRDRPWARVIAVNSVIMTVFLWHLSALLVGVAVLYPLGWPQPAGGTALWWLLRVPWVLVLAAILFGFVALFGRFERPPLRRAEAPPSPGGTGAAAVAAAYLTLGILGFAVAGFHDLASRTGVPLAIVRINPLLSLILIVLGTWLARAAGVARAEAR